MLMLFYPDDNLMLNKLDRLYKKYNGGDNPKGIKPDYSF